MIARMQKNYGVMLVSFLGLMISAIICINVVKWERTQAQHDFENLAKENVFRIRLELKQYLDSLEAIKNFYASSNNVDREEFRTFVTPILKDHPEIQALEWVPKVPHDQLNQFIHQARQSVTADFSITETKTDTLTDATTRDVYYPVYYLEPLSGNEKAIGYDLGSNAERLATLESARDTNELQATGRIHLIQNTPGYGFLVFTPVYKNNSSIDTIEQRRTALQGFILGVFNISNIITNALEDSPHKNASLTLTDLSAPNSERLLFTTNSSIDGTDPSPENFASVFQHHEKLHFAGREWKVSYVSGGDFSKPKQYWQAWLTLIICLLITAWLAQYIKSHQQKTEQVRLQVEAKTRELKNTANALEKLHEITTNNCFTPDEKIAHILQLGLKHFQLSMGIVSQIENDAYTILHIYDRENSLTAGTVFKLADTYCAVTYKANAPIGFNNPESKKHYILPFEDKFGINTYIGTPIMVNGVRFGTLNFTMQESRAIPFNEEDFSVVNIFAQWIGGEISREIANKEISHQKYLFESLFRDTPEPMILIDLNRRIHKVNPAFTKEFGYTEQELIDESTSILYENFDAFMLQGKVLYSHNNNSQLKPYETNYKRKNKQLFPAETVITALTDADNKVYAYLGHIRNITDRKEAEDNLTRQARRAQLLHQVTSIAHETTSFLEALQRCIDLVCDILDWPVAHVYIPDTQHNQLLPANIWHLDDKDAHQEFVDRVNNTTVLRGEGLFGRIWKSGTALWMENSDEHSGLTYLNCATNPFNSAIGFPIYVDHEIVAILGFFTYAKTQTDYDLIRVLQILGEQVGRVFEKRRAEKVIADAEQYVRLILESAGDGLYGLDLNGDTTFVNPAAERMTGYSAEELIGKSMHTLLHHSYPDGTHYPREHCQMENAFTDGAIQHVDDEVLWRKDGSCFPVEYTSTPMWKDGRIVGAVVTFRDISERLKIDRMKQEFISTVSHELRTPLTSILGSLGLISGGVIAKIPEEINQLVEIAQSNSERLLLLINDLLDMEKIASGKMMFDLRLTDLSKLVQQSIESNNNYARQYDVYYDLITPDESFMVNVDNNRFIQVMSNLLSNAAKFSPAGKPVEIRITRQEDKVRISVSDYGPGIPEAFHDKIFGKFSQADSSDTRQKGGTGLGLHITREIVHNMQGTIGFESTPGIGTTFYVDLPDHTRQARLPEIQKYR